MKPTWRSGQEMRAKATGLAEAAVGERENDARGAATNTKRRTSFINNVLLPELTLDSSTFYHSEGKPALLIRVAGGHPVEGREPRWSLRLFGSKRPLMGRASLSLCRLRVRAPSRCPSCDYETWPIVKAQRSRGGTAAGGIVWYYLAKSIRLFHASLRTKLFSYLPPL